MTSLAQSSLQSKARATTNELTQRQSAVLEVALALLVEGGEKALTTAGLARAANCSKESLYRWFGDRDGLLAAIIAYQASKVRLDGADLEPQNAQSYRGSLVAFVRELLSVLFGEASLALNRLAIGQSNRDNARLGKLLLERGKHTISARTRALLDEGLKHGYLAFNDAEEAYQLLYGLAVRDVHIRLLLGEELSKAHADFTAQAQTAVNHFYKLFGAEPSVPNGGET